MGQQQHVAMHSSSMGSGDELEIATNGQNDWRSERWPKQNALCSSEDNEPQLHVPPIDVNMFTIALSSRQERNTNRWWFAKQANKRR